MRAMIVQGLQQAYQNLFHMLAEFLPRTPLAQPAWSTELMRDYWREVPPAG